MTLRSTVLIFCSGALAGGLIAQWRATRPPLVCPAALSAPQLAPKEWYPPPRPPRWDIDPGIYHPRLPEWPPPMPVPPRR